VLNLKDAGRVAQLVEQCPFKAWVAGSNPAALTIAHNNIQGRGCLDSEFPHKNPHKSGTVDSLFGGWGQDRVRV
jgi:hypothetical protein